MKKMMSGSFFLWMAGLVILVVVAGHSAHAISCDEARAPLLPCQQFLTGVAPSPSAPCCSGVSKLKEKSSTTQARREICQCLKDTVKIYLERAKQLPQLCGVGSFTIPLDPNIDCNTIPI